jgi:hypothetical protein
LTDSFVRDLAKIDIVAAIAFCLPNKTSRAPAPR